MYVLFSLIMNYYTMQVTYLVLKVMIMYNTDILHQICGVCVNSNTLYKAGILLF